MIDDDYNEADDAIIDGDGLYVVYNEYRENCENDDDDIDNIDDGNDDGAGLTFHGHDLLDGGELPGDPQQDDVHVSHSSLQKTNQNEKQIKMKNKSKLKTNPRVSPGGRRG